MVASTTCGSSPTTAAAGPVKQKSPCVCLTIGAEVRRASTRARCSTRWCADEHDERDHGSPEGPHKSAGRSARPRRRAALLRLARRHGRWLAGVTLVAFTWFSTHPWNFVAPAYAATRLPRSAPAKERPVTVFDRFEAPWARSSGAGARRAADRRADRRARGRPRRLAGLDGEVRDYFAGISDTLASLVPGGGRPPARADGGGLRREVRGGARPGALGDRPRAPGAAGRAAPGDRRGPTSARRRPRPSRWPTWSPRAVPRLSGSTRRSSPSHRIPPKASPGSTGAPSRSCWARPRRRARGRRAGHQGRHPADAGGPR